MTRLLSVRALSCVLLSSSLILVACADNKTDSDLVTFESAAHNFCGNGRCDHGETCSTCALDCGSCVDAWASTNVQRVLNSAAYQAGTVAVFIWYDEDHPTPNLQIAPTSHKGNITQTGVGTHAALLKTVEDLLGLPFMNQGQLPGATDLRSLLGM